MILNKFFKLSKLNNNFKQLNNLKFINSSIKQIKIDTNQYDKIENYNERIIKLIDNVKNELNNKTNEEQINYWNQLKQNHNLYNLNITPTNFENKFLDLLYKLKIDDKLLLNSLKNYFINQKINTNLIRKYAYAQLLLMLENDQSNNKSNNQSNDQLNDQLNENNKEIENVFNSLKEYNLLGEQICINFINAYSRSSKQRLNRMFNYLESINFKCFQNDKEIYEILEYMNLIFNSGDYDKFFKLFKLLFKFSTYEVLNLFREKSDQIKNEQMFIKLLKSLNLARKTLFIYDIDYVTQRLEKYNFKPTKIKPINSICPNCKQKIPGLEDHELVQLQDYFLDQFKAEIKKVRNEKTKKVLNQYIDFIIFNQNKYDLIIDSLNLGFQGHLSYGLIKTEKRGGFDLKTNNNNFEKNLIKAIDALLKSGKFKNLLFIGRYSQLYYKELNQFLTKNKVQARYFDKFFDDDLAFILASVFNKNCKFLTNDYFTNYQHRMDDDNIKKLFIKFIGCHYMTIQRKNLSINYYNEGWDKIIHTDCDLNNDDFKLLPNKQIKTIHIPFDSENVDYKKIYNWFCFRKII